MSEALNELVKMLSLKRIEERLFEGEVMDPGWGRLYGGHVVGQALAAANQTTALDRCIHSFHSYFLLPGDIREPIQYDVESIRDGGSVSTRRIKAVQSGRVIFFMTASFQADISGIDHQAPMPQVPNPSELLLLDEVITKSSSTAAGQELKVPKFRQPFEIKLVNEEAIKLTKSRDATNSLWLKVDGPLPDDYAVHEFLLAYVSDMFLLPTATFPHAIDFRQPDFNIATIDHSMWFHRHFRLDEWLLYWMESPSASSGRGFTLGRFYDQKGRLIASAAQEGVLRKRLSSN